MNFGDLRHLLTQHPTHFTFIRICELLEEIYVEAPGQWEFEWVPYATEALASWPDAVRYVDKARSVAMLAERTPYSDIVTTLDLSDGGLVQRRTATLAAATHLRHIKRLDLRASGTNWKKLEALTQAPDLFEKLDFFALRMSTGAKIDQRVLDLLFHTPWMAELQEFNTDGWSTFNATAASLLGKAPCFSTVKKLDLNSSKIGIKGSKALISTDPDHPLEELDLGYTSLGAKVFTNLANASFPNLRKLDLFNSVTTDSLAPLASAQNLGPLRELSLRRCSPISADTLKELLDAPIASTLQRLDLHNCRMDHAHAEAIAASQAITTLEHLRVTDNNFEDRGVKELAENAKNLASLDLGFNNLTPKALEALASAPIAAKLERLELHGNSVWVDGARIIAGGAFSNLRELGLMLASIDEDAVKELASASALASVEHLELSNNRNVLSYYVYGADWKKNTIDLESLELLANSPLFANLKYLGLNALGLTDESIERLLNISGFEFPDILNLRNNPLTPEFTATLRDAMAARGVELVELRLGDYQLQRAFQTLRAERAIILPSYAALVEPHVARNIDLADE